MSGREKKERRLASCGWGCDVRVAELDAEEDETAETAGRTEAMRAEGPAAERTARARDTDVRILWWC